MAEIISGEKDDLESEARLFDSFQYRVKLRDGSVEHLRDAEPFDKVRARLLAAKVAARQVDARGADATVEMIAAGQVVFSGGRAVEPGEAEGDEPAVGALRGRGAVEAADVRLLAYSGTDGTETPNQAYESTIALMDVQREGIALQNETMQKQLAGAGAGAGASGKSEDGGADSLVP